MFVVLCVGSSSDIHIHASGSTFHSFAPSSSLSSLTVNPSVHLPYSTYSHCPGFTQSISGPTSNALNQRGAIPSSEPIVDLIIIPDSVVLSPKSPSMQSILVYFDADSSTTGTAVVTVTYA